MKKSRANQQSCPFSQALVVVVFAVHGVGALSAATSREASAQESSETQVFPGRKSRGDENRSVGGLVRSAASATVKDPGNAPSEKSGSESGGAGKVLQVAGNPCQQQDGMTKKSLQMSGEYCAAADAADKAAQSQQLLMGVHAGVAALCLVPCINNAYFMMGEITMGQVCSGAALAAGVTDIITTKKFTGAASVLMAGYGLYQTWGTGKAIADASKFIGPTTPEAAANSEATKAKKEGQKMSCFTAAVETLMSVTNAMGAKDSKKTAEENRKLAAQVIESTLNPDGAAAGVSNSPSGLSAQGATIAGDSKTSARVGTSRASLSSNALLSGTESCGSGFSGQLKCASARGLPVPEIAKHPEFISSLEKLSGVPIDQLMASGDSKSIIGNALGSSLGGEGSQKMKDLIAQAEEKLLEDSAVTSNAVYAGGGGGPAGSGDSGAPDFGKMLGDLMQGMNPGADAQKPEQAGALSLGARNPASSVSSEGISEDRRASLFDRVSRRYVATRDRLAALAYGSAENKALSR